MAVKYIIEIQINCGVFLRRLHLILDKEKGIRFHICETGYYYSHVLLYVFTCVTSVSGNIIIEEYM